MASRGFWNGILTGGLLGAALTAVYLSTGEQPQNMKRVTGKLGNARKMIEHVGDEVARSWRK
jgi:hypothetical protein